MSEVAQFGDAILPGAPTYFIPNEQIAERPNDRIIEVFGSASAALGRSIEAGYRQIAHSTPISGNPPVDGV